MLNIEFTLTQLLVLGIFIKNWSIRFIIYGVVNIFHLLCNCIFLRYSLLAIWVVELAVQNT